MQTFPILYTEHLKLRKLTIEDVERLVELANNKKISDRILNIPHPFREPDAVFRIGYIHRGFKSGVRYVFAITLKETDKFIGEIAVHLDDTNTTAELGYWIGEPYWNNGYMTEAIQAAVKFGFDQLDLHQLFATTDDDNPASSKALRRNGFKKVDSPNKMNLYGLKRSVGVNI